MAMCPMSVPGTEVAASDVVDGEALTFTTGGDVAEFQAAIRASAQRMKGNGCEMMGQTRS
jgi:hypothetical protein